MKESKIFTERNLTEKVHYVYRVTIDGKYYIGKRSGFLNDLHAGRYKTSSKIIQEKLKNGLHFSKIKILQVFSSSKDALEFEKRILLRVNVKANPKFLNQHNGNGNYTFKQHTEETKEKIKEYYNPNTEEGRKRRENHSEFMKENGKNIRQKGAETQIQNRKDASILGDLMFDEDFIRQNLLITDDKNNIRFLWSVYSKLSGYKESSIVKEKRIGKLSFLSGIKSISISEELENAKIEAIEAIIKSKNNQFKGLERQKMV